MDQDSVRSMEGAYCTSSNDQQIQSKMSQSIPQSLENGAGSIKVVSGSGFRYLVPFPYKFHQMLEETEEKGDTYKSIVSWLPGGQHFKVHDSNAFMKQIVPQYFKQKSYKSFQRQLHIYGFKRILKGPLQGAFYHPKFIKGNLQLTHEIDRIKAPVARKNASRAAMATGQNSQEPTTTTTAPQQQQHQQPKSPQDILHWVVSSGVQFSDLEPARIAQEGGARIEQPRYFSEALLSQSEQIATLFTSLEAETKKKQEQLFNQMQPLFGDGPSSTTGTLAVPDQRRQVSTSPNYLSSKAACVLHSQSVTNFLLSNQEGTFPHTKNSEAV